jgi:cytochrome c-type biogenesis protein CcsB
VTVDLGMAGLSNDLLVVAVLAYGLAMLGYAAEFAFAARPRRPRPVAHAASSLEALERAATAPVAPAAVERFGVPDVPAYLLRGDTRAPLAAPPPPRPRAVLLGRVAVALTVLGWAAHVGLVVTRGLAAHRVPWGNMYEFSCAITLAAVTAYLVLLARRDVRYLGAFVMLPVVVTLGLAGTVLYAKAEPLQPALQSYWLKIHVVAAILAWGTFLVGAVVTVLYLQKERYERRVVALSPAALAARRSGGIMRRLPAAEQLDALSYKVIAFGFPIWTFAIIAGAVWAEAAWGRYWGWDPKETWSFITWVVYAGYLHARATAGWSGRRAALIALAGFSALTFDYYVVNLVVTGLHSYAGL